MGRQDPLKTAQKPPKTLKRGPKSPQERPKTPPRRPKNPPRSPLGTVLEPSWDHPITRSKTRSLRVNGGQGLGSILEVKMPPKTTPKRSQNESKIDMKNASLFYPSWSCLGAILGRSWTPSGGQKHVSPMVFTTIS